MAYDDSRFRGEPGFREEPDFRSGGVPEDAPTLGVSGQSVYTPGNYPVSPAYGAPATESTLGLGGARRAAPTPQQLGDVFDDPEHGDPGRDRMAVHVLWELVLLLGAAALLYLLHDARSAALSGGELESLLLSGAELGLVAVAMGLTVRAGAPNLAVGPIAFAAALFFTSNSGRGLLMTAGITGLIAVGVGVVIAVLVVAFHVPGWAVSLAVAFGLISWLSDQHDEKVVTGAYDPHPHALWWAIAVALVAVAGGALGLIGPLRRALGRFRPVRDPAARRGGGAAAFTGLAIAGSALLSAIAGVLIALDQRSVTISDGSAPLGALTLTGLALGAALVGGTSAFGRRGGVFGTVLAAAVITLLLRYTAAEGWKLPQFALAAGAIAIGLVVTRLVETFGRPRTRPDDGEPVSWTPPSITGPAEPADSWSPPSSRTGSWPSSAGDGGYGADGGWGVEERWGTR
ncbi:ABC transporter permease [Dactylosporangium sp. CA-092794]|uniref:ABC transporter permease n=1 Tax=Dactylosporangium sp. CA-092794 TaxID=3239929 RepID=UPI003D92C2BE